MSDPVLSPNGYDFRDIVFGKMEAAKESSNPRLLLEGFLDSFGYIDQLVNGEIYYVFGQKGSGKSAIASRIELMARNEGKIAAKTYILEQFDYSGFTGVIPGNKNDASDRWLRTWEFLIAVKFMELYDSDDVVLRDERINFKGILKGLESSGLIPSKGFNGIIDKVRSKSFKLTASLAGTGAGVDVTDSSDTTNSKIRKMVTNVINAMYGVSPSKKHFIIIDGLDSSLGKRSAEYDVISSLINATDIINRNLVENGINSKVIVLCRDDVLDKLSGTNKNKFTIDSGIHLDWYETIPDPHESNLNKLINLRAKVSLGTDVDVMSEFFPPYMPTGAGNKDTLKYLLENTRHTPRDFIALMNSIQKVSYQKGATVDTIKNGLRKYSDNYFVGEIMDGLHGFISDEDRDRLFRSIQRVGHIVTNTSEIADEMSMSKDEVIPLLEVLYNSGAISNQNPKNGQITSKYRNRHSSFDPHQQIRIHNGLFKAFSLSSEHESDLDDD